MKSNRLKTKLKEIEFKNPLIAASGTVGYGREYENFVPLSELGGISVKGTTKEKRLGNSSPRIAETASGILNSVGLENPGVYGFINNELPWLLEKDTNIIANIAGRDYDEYSFMAEKLNSLRLMQLNLLYPVLMLKRAGLVLEVMLIRF